MSTGPAKIHRVKGYSNFRYLPVALLASLIINLFGLYLMIEANRYISPPVERAPDKQAIVYIKEVEKKPERPRPERENRPPARQNTAALPLPDLPSALSARSLNLNIQGDADLVSQVSGVGHEDLQVSLVLSEDAVDEPPQVVHRVMPVYPPMAEDRGIEGAVTFKLQVSPAGVVEKVWILESQPGGVFEAAAEKAVRQYRFSPARYKGEPVTVMCKQRVVFMLRGG